MRNVFVILFCLFTLPGIPGNPSDLRLLIPDSLSLNTDTISPWKLSLDSRFNLNQVSFTNWAEGGESTFAGNAYAKVNANYKKNEVRADNFLILGYGLTWNEEQQFRKSDDRFEISNTVGYRAFNNWYYSFNFNLKSQFSDGFKYPDDSTLVSTFFAPGKVFLSAGLEYHPDENFSVFVSPASGKFVFVLDQELADKGAFGVVPAKRDTAGIVIVPGQNYNAKFGFNFIFDYNKEILKNVNLDSRLNLHNNYMDENIANRWNLDVDWETAFNFKINSYLSSILFIHVLYDHDTDIPIYEYVEGQKVEVGQGPRTQVKQNFGIGLNIKV
jgi:hypothetical protein